jgi:hypothetical protein
MTKIFIGGSRHVSRLPVQVRKRIDSIIEKGFPILIGDANGADKAVQQYLHSQHYKNVEVFCSDGMCRNNIGNWEMRPIPAGTRERNAQFYSAKDRVMAQEATVGLMMWDGKSIGTLLNVFRLLSLKKKAVIYIVPEKTFREFRSGAKWEDFIARYDSGLQREVEKRARLETPVESQPLLR